MFNFLAFLSAIIFVVIDFIYLNLIKNYFKNQIETVQNTPMKVNILGTLLCYIFLIFGLNYFIIQPKRSVYDAFFLGILIYGVYETTNYALFTKWSFLTVIVDTLWGGTLFASTTFIISQIRKLTGKM
jgi:uncharacterized membrane protein